MSQQINLFSPIFLRQKKYFSAITMLQALGLIVAGTVLFYGYLVYQSSALTEQAAETEKKLASEQARLAKFTSEFSPQKKSAQLEADIRLAEAQLKARQEIMDTLKTGVIGNTDGYSGYMRAFARQSVYGLWLTGFEITGAGNEMAIIGRTLRPELVPVYVQRLSREPVMKGRQFAFLQMGLPQPIKVDGQRAETYRYLEFNLQSLEPGKSQ